MGEVALGQVNGLRNATCEVHQGVCGVAPIQCLVTTCQPGEQQGKNFQLSLTTKVSHLWGKILRFREVKQMAMAK